MCLGVVGQIVAMGHDTQVQVSAGDRTITASTLAVSDTLVRGDWVLVHSGLVLARLTAQEAGEALELRELSR